MRTPTNHFSRNFPLPFSVSLVITSHGGVSSVSTYMGCGCVLCQRGKGADES